MIKRYLKGSLKVLGDYSVVLCIYAVFAFTFINHLMIFSIVVFVLMFLLLYSDMHKVAVREKRPQYNLKPYPLKGFILGVFGFSPFILVELVYPLIILNNTVADRIKHLALSMLLGPLYPFIRIGHESVWAYVIASLVVPVIAGLGYLAGYFRFEWRAFFKKLKKINSSKK